MKQVFLKCSVIATLAIAAAFTSCKDDDKEEPGNGEQLFAGKFKSATGSGDAVFYAGYATKANPALAATEKELFGKIQDGNTIFDLRGFYDTKTQMFLLSAGSRHLVAHQ